MLPFLKELPILPVQYRIWFKITLLTLKCPNNLAPQYLCDLITIYKPNVNYSGCSCLKIYMVLQKPSIKVTFSLFEIEV